MQVRDVVRHRTTGAIGVVLSTIYLAREDGPLSIIFDGGSVAWSDICEADYEVIGRYDAVPDEKGCGMGQGEQCCRFLAVTGKGLTCLRFGEMHWGLVFKGGGKVRDPNQSYPGCQLPQK